MLTSTVMFLTGRCPDFHQEASGRGAAGEDEPRRCREVPAEVQPSSSALLRTSGAREEGAGRPAFRRLKDCVV